MRMIWKGLLPVFLLALLLTVLYFWGPLGVFQAAFPPVEELTIERAELPDTGNIVLHLVNGGPEAVTIAQVMVDDAMWQHQLDPPLRTIRRLARASIIIPYPWVEGEAHEVKLLTSTGVTFSHEIAVATQSPKPDSTYFLTFTLLGIYVGVIPVFLGLLFFPLLRELKPEWLHFFLSLTVGLLAFLVIDTLEAALETSGRVADAFQGVALVGIGALSSLLVLMVLSRSKPTRADKGQAEGRSWTALLIAIGIGLHNLGEGLAVGSSYALGEVALGTFLVVGFTLHNLTEGIGIVAPIARDQPSVSQLCKLGLIAGLPTVFGAWLGGFSYSPIAATLFMAIGAGAILQVIFELFQLLNRRESSWATIHNLSGFMLGMGVMYGTGLLVLG